MTFFARLYLHLRKFFPNASRLDAVRVVSLGLVVSPDGVLPTDQNVTSLTRMPTSMDINQLCSLLDGISSTFKHPP